MAPSLISSGRLDGGGVDRDLVGAGQQHGANVVDAADAAADGERDEDRVGGAPGHVEHDLAALVRGGDVQKDQLVGLLGVVDGRLLDRIAGVAQVDEVDALDDTPVLDVEAGDDSFGEHCECPGYRDSGFRVQGTEPAVIGVLLRSCRGFVNLSLRQGLRQG